MEDIEDKDEPKWISIACVPSMGFITKEIKIKGIAKIKGKRYARPFFIPFIYRPDFDIEFVGLKNQLVKGMNKAINDHILNSL